MSQVFPTSLAVTSTNSAFARGSFWFGIVCLSATFLVILLIVPSLPGTGAYAAFPALLLMVAGAVVLVRMRRRVPVLIGAVALLELLSMAWYTHTVMSYQEQDAPSDNLLLTLPVIALTMFGVTASRVIRGLVGCVIAYAVAQGIVVVAAVGFGHPVAFDVGATSIFFVIVLTLGLLGRARRMARSIEPQILRADEVDSAALTRELAESRASALVHDTILNELAVVATREPGPLPKRARDRIAASIAELREDAPVAGVEGRAVDGALAAAIEHARSSGLEVTLAGQFGTEVLLDDDTATALGLAVRQCLGNVAAHAGTGSAEVAVIAADSTLTVMVIDSGVGFIEEQVGRDRLGLRNSVRRRIEDVGGTVQLWTTPGVGTSVSITVPLR